MRHPIQYTTLQWWMAIVFLIILLIGPGNIEGKIAPAAAPMKLIDADISPDNQSTVFYGTTTRLRPECSFRSIKWYIGKREGRDAPVRTEAGPSKVRPDGDFDFGPWKVWMTPVTAFISNSYSDVFHACKWFGIQMPWEVRSPFWN